MKPRARAQIRRVTRSAPLAACAVVLALTHAGIASAAGTASASTDTAAPSTEQLYRVHVDIAGVAMIDWNSILKGEVQFSFNPLSPAYPVALLDGSATKVTAAPLFQFRKAFQGSDTLLADQGGQGCTTLLDTTKGGFPATSAGIVVRATDPWTVSASALRSREAFGSCGGSNPFDANCAPYEMGAVSKTHTVKDFALNSDGNYVGTGATVNDGAGGYRYARSDSLALRNSGKHGVYQVCYRVSVRKVLPQITEKATVYVESGHSGLMRLIMKTKAALKTGSGTVTMGSTTLGALPVNIKTHSEGGFSIGSAFYKATKAQEWLRKSDKTSFDNLLCGLTKSITLTVTDSAKVQYTHTFTGDELSLSLTQAGSLRDRCKK